MFCSCSFSIFTFPLNYFTVTDLFFILPGHQLRYLHTSMTHPCSYQAYYPHMAMQEKRTITCKILGFILEGRGGMVDGYRRMEGGGEEEEGRRGGGEEEGGGRREEGGGRRCLGCGKSSQRGTAAVVVEGEEEEGSPQGREVNALGSGSSSSSSSSSSRGLGELLEGSGGLDKCSFKDFHLFSSFNSFAKEDQHPLQALFTQPLCAHPVVDQPSPLELRVIVCYTEARTGTVFSTRKRKLELLFLFFVVREAEERRFACDCVTGVWCRPNHTSHYGSSSARSEAIAFS